jgi:hypothetical protein
MILNFNKATRCQCNNVTNRTVCLNKCKTLYAANDKLYCWYHFRYYRDSYATRIQSVYRGNRQRKLLTNIYKRLPDDLQHLVLYYVKKETYEKRYLKTIKNIIEKRLSLLEDDMFNYCELINRDMKDYLILNNVSVLECCRLYNKYYRVFDNGSTHKKFMIKLVRNLKHMIYIGNDVYETNIYRMYILMEWTIRPSRA